MDYYHRLTNQSVLPLLKIIRYLLALTCLIIILIVLNKDFLPSTLLTTEN